MFQHCTATVCIQIPCKLCLAVRFRPDIQYILNARHHNCAGQVVHFRSIAGRSFGFAVRTVRRCIRFLPAGCIGRCICRPIFGCCVLTDLFLIRSCQPRLHANALVPVRAFARFRLCLQTASGRPQKDDSQRCSPQPVLPPFLTFSAPAHKSMILSIPSYPQTVTIAEPPLIFRAFGAPKIGSSNVTIILHD